MKKFQGNLEKIAPDLLIKEDNNNDYDNFFLVLGVVFNDLKDLVLFHVMLTQVYEKSTGQINVHDGESGGVQIHLTKLYASTVCEFLKFIETYKETISSIEFQVILGSLSNSQKLLWGDIVRIALSGTANNTFTQILVQIRDNITFHFYGSSKTLRKAFIGRFLSQRKEGPNDSAYYSFGKNMESTRFYYCDATIEEYLRQQAYRVDKNDPLALNQQLKDVVEKMNETIIALMSVYLNSKKK